MSAGSAPATPFTTTPRLADVVATTIGDLLHRNAAAFGDRDAMVMEGRVTTWRELDDTVDRLAAGLAGLGVGHGDRVAILLPNREEVVHTYFAVARLGAVVVPLNPALTGREIGELLTDSAVRVVVCSAAHTALLTGLAGAGSVPSVEGVVSVDGAEDAVLSYADLLATGRPAPRVAVAPSDVAVTYYTSGTTGRPKGALHTHFSVLATALASGLMQGLTDADRVLLVTPLYHSAAMHVFLMANTLFGGSWVIMREFRPDAVLATIAADRVTTYFGVVPMLIATLDCPDFDTTDLSSLRVVFTGASPVPDALKKRCVAAFGPDVALIDGYGCTESGPAGTAIFTADALERPGSVGKPWPYLQAAVVDTSGRPVGPGETGEIVLRGPSEMLGYHGMPAETEAAFAGGWLHTGDLGRMDAEGFLYVTGRTKDMLIRGGVNIYPREIEEVLYDHPGVAEAAVIGVPDDFMGEEVMALVIPRNGASLAADELVEHCRKRLAKFKVPRFIQLVDELPRNATGKILKFRLRERYAEPRTRGTRLEVH